MPVRLGLSPTFSTVSSAPGVIAAATSQKAAELMSPGTSTVCPCRLEPGVTVTTVRSGPLTSSCAPKARSIRSLWSRLWAGSITVVGPSAVRPASRIALFTWAEATGVWIVAPWSCWPCTASGAKLPPLRPWIRAPICESGSPTRRIGRPRREPSPLSTK